MYQRSLQHENYLRDPYITIYPQGDLNNRLQVLLAYLYKANTENKQLRVIWIIDDKCTQNFEDLFESINNVEFIYTNSIPSNEIDYVITWSPETEYIKYKYYKYLIPKEDIQLEINQFTSDYIACYITDTGTNNYTPFINLINKYPENLKIYLVTDNNDTLKYFIDIYGSRIVYNKIVKINNLLQYNEHDLVRDIYICANSTYFKGSTPNSTTKTINELRKLNT